MVLVEPAYVATQATLLGIKSSWFLTSVPLSSDTGQLDHTYELQEEINTDQSLLYSLINQFKNYDNVSFLV